MEEKKQIVLEIFHESKDVFVLKVWNDIHHDLTCLSTDLHLSYL